MKCSDSLIVTIDGVAGAGKTTAAASLAKALGILHLNSGALYRAVGLLAATESIPLEDEPRVLELAQLLPFSYRPVDGRFHLFVGSENYSAEVKTELAAQCAAKVAKLVSLRAYLVEVQREIAGGQPLVLEGRDAGSVVFPAAPAKFFLTASAAVRAERRALEHGMQDQVEELQREIEARDQSDFQRQDSQAAADAEFVDTSDLTQTNVIEHLVSALERRGLLFR